MDMVGINDYVLFNRLCDSWSVRLARKLKMYREGRVCKEEGCTTVLRQSNPHKYCTLHHNQRQWEKIVKLAEEKDGSGRNRDLQNRLTRDVLKQLYIDEFRTANYICEKLVVCKPTLIKYLRKYGLKKCPVIKK